MSFNSPEVKPSEVKLSSIINFRKSIAENCHQTMKKLFSEHVFVGCVNTRSSLIQHGTNLYLCNTEKIIEELFYQLIIYNFSNFGSITFSTPLPIFNLAMLALDHPDAEWSEEDGAKEELAERVVEILYEKRDMLKEYFSFEIDDSNCLIKLPLLLGIYIV